MAELDVRGVGWGCCGVLHPKPSRYPADMGLPAVGQIKSTLVIGIILVKYQLTWWYCLIRL